MRQLIAVPTVPLSRFAGCHAAKGKRLTWTGAITGSSKNGGGDRAEAEVSEALTNLERVLAAAGHGLDDLVHVNAYYAAAMADSTTLQSCQQVIVSRIDTRSCAGTSVFLEPAVGGTRFAIEAIAAPAGTKRVAYPVAAVRTGPWAVATRVDSTIYLSGVGPTEALYGDGVATSGEHAQESEFYSRSYSAYRNLACAVRAVTLAWPDCKGLEDLVRLHQHVTKPAIDLAEFRRSRADLLRAEEFVSATVRALPGDPDYFGRDPWMKVDGELAVGARRRISVPSVWANPGGLHVTLAGELAFVQAQMGRTQTGANAGQGDPERHAEQLYRNLDRMLEGAGLTWKQVVHARGFCREASMVDIAARKLQERSGGHPCPGTWLMAGFFDPEALLEIEITASL